MPRQQDRGTLLEIEAEAEAPGFEADAEVVKTVLIQAFGLYVRPLLEFSSQVWSPHHKYLIDKVESVQRFFTKRLSGL